VRARLPVKKKEKRSPPHTRVLLEKKKHVEARTKRREGGTKNAREILFTYILRVFFSPLLFTQICLAGSLSFFAANTKETARRDRKNKAHESVSTHTEVVESRCQRWVLLFARTKLRPGRLERGDRRTRVDRRDRSSSRGEDRNRRRRRRRRRRRLSAVKEGRTKEEELLRRRRR